MNNIGHMNRQSDGIVFHIQFDSRAHGEVPVNAQSQQTQVRQASVGQVLQWIFASRHCRSHTAESRLVC